MADPQAPSPRIYKVVDDAGRVTLVTDPNDVPPELRARLIEATPQGSVTIEPAWKPPTDVAGVHVPSLLLGLVGGALVGALVGARKKSVLVRVAVLVGGIALLSTLYLGFVVRLAGLSDDKVATPTEILEQAKAARDGANAATAAKEKAADALAKD